MRRNQGRVRNASLLAVVVLAVAAGCSSGSGPDRAADATTTSAPVTERVTYPVGVTTDVLVDETRPTAATADEPEHDARTLDTTIFYPATGEHLDDAGALPADVDAPPATDDGPFPLVVFGHGLGANPEVYEPLLTAWAAAGFVVAAPAFPLSNSAAPGGPTAGDVASQPGDLGFVIDEMLGRSAGDDPVLAGLVDGDRVGAAGHSYGAVTTVGLVGHTCCTDDRVDAAIVMAGAMAPLSEGDYDLADAPPLLVVHGTDDALIPYAEGVEIFNATGGPKGIVTVAGGDHMAAAGGVGDDLVPVVVEATTDFLLGELAGDAAALQRLADLDEPDVATVEFVPDAGSNVTIPLPDRPDVDLHATAEPTDDLTGGRTVTVTWSGFTPGEVVNILQCSADNANLDDQGACDFDNAVLLHEDPDGAGSVELEVVSGAVGTGTCDADHQGCFIVVNDGSSPDPDSMVKIPITMGDGGGDDR